MKQYLQELRKIASLIKTAEQLQQFDLVELSLPTKEKNREFAFHEGIVLSVNGNMITLYLTNGPLKGKTQNVDITKRIPQKIDEVPTEIFFRTVPAVIWKGFNIDFKSEPLPDDLVGLMKPILLDIGYIKDPKTQWDFRLKAAEDTVGLEGYIDDIVGHWDLPALISIHSDGAITYVSYANYWDETRPSDSPEIQERKEQTAKWRASNFVEQVNTWVYREFWKGEARFWPPYKIELNEYLYWQINPWDLK